MKKIVTLLLLPHLLVPFLAKDNKFDNLKSRKLYNIGHYRVYRPNDTTFFYTSDVYGNSLKLYINTRKLCVGNLPLCDRSFKIFLVEDNYQMHLSSHKGEDILIVAFVLHDKKVRYTNPNSDIPYPTYFEFGSYDHLDSNETLLLQARSSSLEASIDNILKNYYDETYTTFLITKEFKVLNSIIKAHPNSRFMVDSQYIEIVYKPPIEMSKIRAITAIWYGLVLGDFRDEKFIHFLTTKYNTTISIQPPETSNVYGIKKTKTRNIIRLFTTLQCKEEFTNKT